jgi:hypothetical protein
VAKCKICGATCKGDICRDCDREADRLAAKMLPETIKAKQVYIGKLLLANGAVR